MTIYGDFKIVDNFTLNNMIITICLDYNGEIFYRFLITTNLKLSNLNNTQEFFYRNIDDLIYDLRDTLVELSQTEFIDENEKNNLLYDIPRIIKILQTLYK